MSKLTEFYTSMLDLCGVELANHGRLVYRSVSDEENPIEIPLVYGGKPIVFPDKQHLDNPENQSGEVIILHPLSESSMRAPSEVQEVLRKAAIVRICEVGDFLLQRAIKINHDVTMDKSIKLNHKLSGLFLDVGDVDVKFATWFNKLNKAMQENTTYRLFNIFLKMHGEVGKNKFDRVGVISSPLYDELSLASDSTTIFGVEGGRKKDIATLLRILDLLFPELAKGGYISGSSSGTAPTLMAFMESIALIADRFNELLTVYGKEAKGISRGTTRGVAFDRDVSLSALRSAHPIEDFNIGVGKEASEKRHNASAPTASPKREEPVVVEKRKTVPLDLEVPIRQAAATTSEVSRKAAEVEEGVTGVPDNAFWLDNERDSRGRRDERESRYDPRDDRDSRDDRYYRDDRRDSRDDRYYRDDRRDSRDSRYDSRRDNYRDDRRDYRDERRDSRDSRYDGRRDDRNSRSDREGYGGQFWESRR